MRTATQCKNKIKNLTDDYKRVKDSNNKSGNSRQNSPYYSLMDEILGTRDSTQPKNIVDVGSNEIHSSEGEVERNETPQDENPNENEKAGVKVEDGVKNDKSTRDVEKKRGKKRASSDIDVMIQYMEESEKREKAFLMRLAEMDKDREERQQEKNMKMIAEIAKILKN